MDRSTLLSMTVGVSVINGMISPATFAVFVLWPAWYPSLVAPVSVNWIYFLSSILVATVTLLVSAVGAAFYERIGGHAETNATSAGIWFGTAVVLTLPGLARLSGL